ncbi:MAG: Rrf2 family protein [Myxococcota bacterium]|jgi:Rrf2 family protein
MRFSESAMYAMRAMATIANQADGQPLRSSDIAGPAQIPDPYLSKVLRRLVVGGLLESRRGRNGGFLLARPADDITFAQILKAMDALPESGVCAFGYGVCNPEQPCSLHPIWMRYVAYTEAWAYATTLDDLGPAGEIPGWGAGGQLPHPVSSDA